MATRIIEYGGADRTDRLNVIPRPNVTQAALTATAVSQQSAAFNAGTTLVCLDSDEKVHYLVGSNPTATVNDAAVAAGRKEFMTVLPGEKVAIRTP